MLALDGGTYQVTLVESQPGIETVSQPQGDAGPGQPPVRICPGQQCSGGTSTRLEQRGDLHRDRQRQLAQSAERGPALLDYGFRGDELQVGGVDASRTWLLVGNTDGSAWMGGNLGFLQGDYASLPVYDIPYREARRPQVIVRELARQCLPQSSNTAIGFLGEHWEHEDEHEGYDD